MGTFQTGYPTLISPKAYSHICIVLVFSPPGSDSPRCDSYSVKPESGCISPAQIISCVGLVISRGFAVLEILDGLHTFLLDA